MDSAEMWAKTAEGVDGILKDIDDGSMTATKEGRAFLAGAASAMRAMAAGTPVSIETAESSARAGTAQVNGM